MIDIPLGKALAPERGEFKCPDCFLYATCTEDIACCGIDREDDKNVIFKLVDLPREEKK